MKVVGIILICLVISACSSTKVHLYTRYLSASESSEISKNLAALGFDIIANNLAFPESVEQSTLLYSPLIQGRESVNLLITSLEDSGWLIPSVQPIFAGNHYYTKNSLGLLLLPEGAKQNDQVHRQDLINEYESTACNASITLKLNSDASYQFLYPDKEASQEEQLQGSWQITSYPYIELVSSKKFRRFYYEIQRKTETDVVGKIALIELKPIEDHYTLPKCTFSYGLRQ